MASPVCAAPQCDNPPHDGYLCPSCLGALQRDLKAVTWLLEDLQVTIARQDKIGDSSEGRRTDERPLPLRLGPMEARRDLTDTIYAWACHVAGRRGIDPPPHEAQTSADFLSRYTGEVQDDPKAGDLADEIGYAVIMAQRAVDKPLQHQYVGPCDECGADLYAHPKAREVTCRNQPCEATYNVEERRAWLLGKAEDRLLTATEISRALPSLLQETLTAAMIRGWAHTGKLTKHPPHPKRPKDPLYRVGDVVTLVHKIHRGEERLAG